MKCETKDSDDYCAICYVEALWDAPCIRAGCRHAYHYHCIVGRLAAGYSGARISFAFRKCPQDMKPFSHPALDEVLEPINAMENRIKSLAMQSLVHDERLRDDKLVNPDSEYYNNPEAYSLHIYLFFMCYECKKPYFAGGYQCQPPNAGFDESELVCPACQPESKNIEECPKHGKDWIAFKCRFCCQFANWFCWTKTHFCDNCHKSGTWQTLAEFQSGLNKRKIWEYDQCESLRPSVEKIRNSGLDDEKMMVQFEKLLSDPKKCPLGIRHPPNGIEFGMGCTMCADKDSDEENKKAQEVHAQEAEEKKQFDGIIQNMGRRQVFNYSSDGDENGFVFFVGTRGRTLPYRNPALSFYLTITSSAFSGESEKPSAITSSMPSSFISLEDANAFVTFSFHEMFSIKLDRYSIRHHSKLAAHFLRNWDFQGSVDGNTWKTLKEHRNDRNFNSAAQICSWKCSQKQGYRHFKILLRGSNSSNANVIALGGIEFYGEVSF